MLYNNKGNEISKELADFLDLGIVALTRKCVPFPVTFDDHASRE